MNLAWVQVTSSPIDGDHPVDFHCSFAHRAGGASSCYGLPHRDLRRPSIEAWPAVEMATKRHDGFSRQIEACE